VRRGGCSAAARSGARGVRAGYDGAGDGRRARSGIQRAGQWCLDSHPGAGLQTLTGLGEGFAFEGVPDGAYTIRIDRIRYAVLEQVLVVGASDITLPLSLTTAAVELGAIVVTPGRFGVMGNAAVRQQQTLTREDLETVLQIGEDVFSVLRTIPGVAVDDISTRLNVRGGSDVELLNLLDGMELYEPYHLEGFDGVFGIVDVQSIGGIDLITDGFGVEHGDKLTGVFDMRNGRGHGADHECRRAWWGRRSEGGGPGGRTVRCAHAAGGGPVR
jgi:hypothetical protein